MGVSFSVFVRFLKDFLFDFHVPVFVGVEDLTAVQALNVFDIFFTRYDAYLGVFAGGVHLEGSSMKPVLLGKIVPAGFRLSNLFLRFFRKLVTCGLPRRDANGGIQVDSSVTERAGSAFSERSSSLPKIILPDAVCSTLVTVISTARPIMRRAWSTTTMVPSPR